MALKRIEKELKDFINKKTENDEIFAGPTNETDLFQWTACIKGVKNTLYEGGYFFIDIKLPQDYPFKPPRVHFTTKILHPNINKNGGLNLDILHNQWSPALTIHTILLSINSLLSDPNFDDPLELELSYLYKKNKSEYEQKVREAVKKYAM